MNEDEYKQFPDDNESEEDYESSSELARLRPGSKKEQKKDEDSEDAEWNSDIKATLNHSANSSLNGKLSGLFAGMQNQFASFTRWIPSLMKHPVKAGVSLAVVISGVLGTGAYIQRKRIMELALLSDAKPDCYESTEDLASNSGTQAVAGMEAAGEMLENAKKVYSFFKTEGMSDYAIAGLLGNWQRESQINPATMETLYTNQSEEDMALAMDLMSDLTTYKKLDSFTRNKVFPAYSISINTTFYCEGKNSEGQNVCLPGIGLGQTTGPNVINYVEWMRSAGLKPEEDWLKIEVNLAYFMSEGTAHYDQTMKLFDQNFTSAGDAALWVVNYWEFAAGAPDTVDKPGRMQYAENWYEQMKTWEVDKAFANSVLKLAQTSMRRADTKQNQEIQSSCRKICSEDLANIEDLGDKDLATLIASYAYPYLDYNGTECAVQPTELFAKLFNTVMSDDPWITLDNGAQYIGTGDRKAVASCDRGVVTAIKTLGIDTEIPKGNTTDIYNYLMAENSRWKRIAQDVNSIEKLESELGCEDDETFKDKLPVGAIFCTKAQPGHIFAYVSWDVMQEVHGQEVYEEGGYYSEGVRAGEEIDTVHAEFGNKRTPYGSCLANWLGKSGDAIYGGGTYDVFVCVDPEGSSEYTDAIAASYKKQTACLDTGVVGAKGAEAEPDFMNPKIYGAESGNPMINNVYSCCNYSNWQCTTFAWSRFKEVWGYDPVFSGNGRDCVATQIANSAGTEHEWVAVDTPVPGSIFSEDHGDYGHVGIVVSFDQETQMITVDEAHVHPYNGMYPACMQIVDMANGRKATYMRRTTPLSERTNITFCAPKK